MYQMEFVEQIKSADSIVLSDIVQAVLARYRDLYPNEEVVFFSFPERDRDARVSLLRSIADFIELHE